LELRGFTQRGYSQLLVTPTADAIRSQLARLETSPEFAGSARLFAFLHFIVEETLANGGVGLKEVVIGNTIYGRDPPYDSRIDSTVRVEARRLRRKLVEFYRGSGESDPILITLPIGGYVPCFSSRTPGTRSPAEPAEGEAIFRAGKGATLAILPFKPIPRQADLETFADGLTDELIFTMGQAEGIMVASRAAAFHDEGRSTADIAQMLGANAVMLGSVRQVDRVLRVTIELSDVDGFVVWSDRFEANIDAPRGEFQDKIARTLLSRARLDSSRMKEFAIEPGPRALRANAKIYKARSFLDLQTPASIAEARRLFAQVADGVPDYARGFSGLADCACDLFRLGVINRDQALADATDAVRRALSIDGRSVEANAALATIYAWLDRDPPKAAAAFEHVRSLGVSARANRLFGVFLTLFGQHEKARRLFREARELEPFSTQQDVAEAICHYQSRRYAMLTEDAASLWAASRSGEVLYFKALAHIFAEDLNGARACLSFSGRQCEGMPDYAFARAEVAAWLGDREAAEELRASPGERSTAFARATLSAALSDERAMLDCLEEAFDRGELSTAWMRSDPRFDRYRSGARFKLLHTRLLPLKPSS